MEHNNLYNHRHSLAHVLAQAIQRSLDPKVQLGTGPAIENGFYYDVLFPSWKEGVGGDLSHWTWSSPTLLAKEGVFGEANLKPLQKIMEGIVKEGQGFASYTAKNLEEAKAIVTNLGQHFKIELLDKFFAADKDTKYTFWYNYVDTQMLPRLEKTCNPEYIEQYKRLTEYMSSLSDRMNPGTGRGTEGEVAGLGWDKFITFIDLCEGWHVESLKDIPDGSFALEKIAGAYRQAKDTNPMMTRIYGIAFETKAELKDYQTMMEEAKKRDHRILGKQLKLFTISELVGSGLPLFQPNGMIVRKEIEDYLWALHKEHGYSRVWTPHIAKEDLYNTSGHAKHYLDDMFKVHGGTSNEDFYLKPMNCPHHMQLFADNQFSYRDMPIRYFEPATVYRDEKTGQLSWLTRVRSITQDDGHLFCRIIQLKDEITTIVKIIKEFYKTMGMLDGYRVSLSVRGEDKEKYLGGEEVRSTAEWALKEICNELELNYKEIPGEAAFYGPKLDFMFKDAIGRQHQLATVQVDFNLPQRFDLSFVNEAGENERPVVIHRAIAGSLERFMGVMIEHFAGAFPLWMAPIQMMIVPVADVFNDYAFALNSQFKSHDLRSRVDESSDSFAKKIRNAELLKIPYILIIGEKEVSDNSVSVRVYKTKEQYTMSVEEFVAKMESEVKERVL
jgi:threonyl-tRNA synthetase